MSQLPQNRPERDYRVEELPNVGREAHTFAYHLTARYDSLADYTVFLQVQRSASLQQTQTQLTILLRSSVDGHQSTNCHKKTSCSKNRPSPAAIQTPETSLFSVSARTALRAAQHFLLSDGVLPPAGRSFSAQQSLSGALAAPCRPRSCPAALQGLHD